MLRQFLLSDCEWMAPAELGSVRGSFHVRALQRCVRLGYVARRSRVGPQSRFEGGGGSEYRITEAGRQVARGERRRTCEA